MTTITTCRTTWQCLDLRTWVSPGWSVLYLDDRTVIPGWYLARDGGTDLCRVGAFLDEEPAALRQADRLIGRAETGGAA